MTLTLQLYALVWGAVWGSFLNVVVYRLPRGLSLVRPGSRCGACGTPIRWYDNVPVLSYLVLRGRCRACRSEYSPRYALVEAACGVLSLLIFQQTVLPLDPATLQAGVLHWLWLQGFVYALVTITFIDLEWTFIPDEITYPTLGLGLLGAFLLPGQTGIDQTLGAIAGGGFLLLVYVVGFVVFRREAMGLGDAKLLAMIGAFLGWRLLPFVMLASALQAIAAVAIASLYARVTGKGEGLTMTTEELDERFDEVGLYEDDRSHVVVPYGPFLALAALEALLFGDAILWVLVDGIVRWMLPAA